MAISLFNSVCSLVYGAEWPVWEYRCSTQYRNVNLKKGFEISASLNGDRNQNYLIDED